MHQSYPCQHNKQHCQARFKALKCEERKIKNFVALVAPQNENQCLPNFAYSLLVTEVNISALSESQ
jgi:hypothetical protein